MKGRGDCFWSRHHEWSIGMVLVVVFGVLGSSGVGVGLAWSHDVALVPVFGPGAGAADTGPAALGVSVGTGLAQRAAGDSRNAGNNNNNNNDDDNNDDDDGESRWERIVRLGEIAVQVRAANPPFAAIDAERRLYGLEVDLAHYLARRLGVIARVTSHDAGVVAREPLHACCDMTLAGISARRDLSAPLPFPALEPEAVDTSIATEEATLLPSSTAIRTTAPYLYMPHYLILGVGVSIGTPSDLLGLRVGYIGFDGSQAWLEGKRQWQWGYHWSSLRSLPSLGSSRAVGVLFADVVDVLDELSAGGRGLSAAVVGLAGRAISQTADLGLKTWHHPVFIAPLVGMLRSEDHELGSRIDTALQQLHDDNTIARLSLKWLSADLSSYRRSFRWSVKDAADAAGS